MSAKDLIILNNLGFYGYHGALSEENRLGQRFWIDFTAGLDLSAPARSDDLSDAVSYADVFDVIQATFSNTRFNLIEALAQSIADAVFAAFPAIETIRIRIRKPEAPIPMVAGEAAIELYRERS
ncbi:7,8-dihydroneopterin aldolase [Youhaiella tibetensis]|uniref:7,8-dihydroneopterin aldolase n=1 Tax=Paradevosia tibetensis TaxID=1447062 RepID=A0A5B9DQ38_9HYPH|nr:dihydroneopterin aldolase [Youhaiella tibetensis]QEE21065.1 dihydroneopterin aldolase [Youhaiella tibetensis]GGF18410.1 7,8-dihydroneopterin aldolase [Youhaiella tibetensis]